VEEMQSFEQESLMASSFRVIEMLKKKKVQDINIRIKYACLTIIPSIVLSKSQFPSYFIMSMWCWFTIVMNLWLVLGLCCIWNVGVIHGWIWWNFIVPKLCYTERICWCNSTSDDCKLKNLELDRLLLCWSFGSCTCVTHGE